MEADVEPAFVKLGDRYFNVTAIEAFQWSEEVGTLEVKVERNWIKITGSDAQIGYERLQQYVANTS